jgi:hypothetical protein
MEERLITHLDECLAAIMAGESIESCVARYPDEADDLASLLQVALALEELPHLGPSAATTRAARTQFLGEATRRHSSKGAFLGLGGISRLWAQLKRRLAAPSWSAPVRALATAAITLALILVIGGGVLHASSGSLPGDPLYGFKLLGEDMQRAVALSRASRTNLEEVLSARRQAEVRRLLELGRQEEVNFGGMLSNRSGDQWLIEDIPVFVSSDARVQNGPTANAYLEIHGITRADGTVQAFLIETEGAEIIGRIEAIKPDLWEVAGYGIKVDEKTYLEVRLQQGDCVEVHARRFSDGVLLALEIERSEGCQDDAAQDRAATPTAGAAPSPTWTPTATPTPTVEPTATALPSFESGKDADGETKATPTLQPPAEDTDKPGEDGSSGGGDDDHDDGDDDGDGGGDDDHDEGDDGGGDDDDDGGDDSSGGGGGDDDSDSGDDAGEDGGDDEEDKGDGDDDGGGDDGEDGGDHEGGDEEKDKDGDDDKGD